MKDAQHAIHPAVISALTALDAALASAYPNADYAYQLYVEGQKVATSGDHDDTKPVAWPAKDVEALAKERAAKVRPAKKISPNPEPKDAPDNS